MPSEIPKGAIFVDYTFRIDAKGITFEDKAPENLTLEAMNRYGDYQLGDKFVLKEVDGQLFLQRQLRGPLPFV